MRVLLLFFMTLVFLSFVSKDVSENELKVTISPKSWLYIKGTSNVNTFTCNFDATQFQESKQVQYRKNGKMMTFEDAILKLKNKGFNCGNNRINKDFHQLLKTNQYPHIQLEVKSVRLETERTTATVIIEIANIKKNYEVLITAPAKVFNYEGTLCVDIKDFDLKPPKKLMGLIAVHDEIEINFKLALEF